ncbi:hypothetical protein FO519_006672 [Halicephalobus sp. NKZ332]|nr:hypothetical protein FO519_006672 [Halicephalobus sp. NKZ332]
MNSKELNLNSVHRWIYLSIEFVSGLFQLSMLIFFLYMQIRKRGFYRYPYYVLLTLYMIADSPRFIGVLIDFWTEDSLFKREFIKWFNLYFWFDMIFANFCQLGIGLNRLTAVLHPMKHVFLWSKKMTLIICLLVILISFLAIFGVGYLEKDPGNLLALCVILSLTTLIICIYTTARTVCLKKNVYSIVNNNPRVKMERNLLQQALFTNINCILYFFFFQLEKMGLEWTWFSSQDSINNIFRFLQLVFFTMEHFGSLVFLLMTSHTVRNEFIDFYTLRVYREKCIHDNEITVQPVKTLWIPLTIPLPFHD